MNANADDDHGRPAPKTRDDLNAELRRAIGASAASRLTRYERALFGPKVKPGDDGDPE